MAIGLCNCAYLDCTSQAEFVKSLALSPIEDIYNIPILAQIIGFCQLLFSTLYKNTSSFKWGVFVYPQ